MGAKIEPSEDAIQRAVFRHIKARGVPGLVAFHPMNGGVHQRGRRRAIHAGIGVLAGASDVILLHGGRFYALELKRAGGRATEAQLKFLADVAEAGGYSALCDSLDRALAVLESWGLLRGRAK